MTDTTITRQIRLERRLPSYWRVTFDHPPLNIFGPETIPQLNDGKVVRETQYFADPFEAPAWRSQWVQQIE